MTSHDRFLSSNIEIPSQNRLGKPHLRTLHGRVGAAAIFLAIGAPLLGALAFRAIGLTARLPAHWQPRVKSAHRVVRKNKMKRDRKEKRGEGSRDFRERSQKNSTSSKKKLKTKKTLTLSTRPALPLGLSPSRRRCWGSRTQQ